MDAFRKDVAADDPEAADGRSTKRLRDQRGSGQCLVSGRLQLDLPDHVPIGVQLEVEPDGFLAPETANPARQWFTASKGSSCQRQPAVPSSWMCSMNSATGLPSGNVIVSALRIWV